MPNKHDPVFVPRIDRHGHRIDHKYEDGKFHTITTDPAERSILEQNQQLRNEGAVRKGKDIWHQLSFPPLALAQLKVKYPDLEAPDMQIRAKAWNRFMQSSESIPYRVM